MKEDANGNKTYYVRDAGGTLLSVYTATGATPQQQEVMLYGSGRQGMAYKNGNNYEYMYEVKDHLGTVRGVFTAVPGSSIATTDVADYYPFGLRMRGNLNSYRFGYQSLSRSCIGREYAEDETEETGWNSFEARMYDPVIGRWLSVDPARVGFSPYVGMANNPIGAIDPDGTTPVAPVVGYKNPDNFFKRFVN